MNQNFAIRMTSISPSEAEQVPASESPEVVAARAAEWAAFEQACKDAATAPSTSPLEEWAEAALSKREPQAGS